MILIGCYKLPGKHLFEGVSEVFFKLTHANLPAALTAQAGHLHAVKTTGVDPGKWFERYIDIKRQAMKSNPMPNGNADTAHFSVTCPDTTISGIPLGRDTDGCRQTDHGFFKEMDIVSNGQPCLAQIKDRVDYQLSRTMVGYITAALDMDQRDVLLPEELFRYHQILAPTPPTQGKCTRMFSDQKYIIAFRTIPAFFHKIQLQGIGRRIVG
jgi:hypothetical protein